MRVVMVNEGGDDTLGLVGSGGGLGTNHIDFEGLVEPLDLSVGLRMTGGGANMGDTGVANAGLAVGGDLLWAIVGDDPGVAPALMSGARSMIRSTSASFKDSRSSLWTR
jgi:hypothetical protein